MSVLAGSLESLAESLSSLGADPAPLTAEHSLSLLDLPYEMHAKLDRMVQARDISWEAILRAKK